MAIHNDTAPIKMSQIAAEFSQTFSNMHLKSYYRGGGIVGTNNTNVPVSPNPIGVKSFYGAAAAFTYSDIIASDTYYYDLYSVAVAAGWNKVIPLKFSATINNGVVVGSGPATIPWYWLKQAFYVQGTFPAGSEITIYNNGYIVGQGACGGGGGQWPWENSGAGQGAGWPGYNGWDALYVETPVIIYNYGTIGGGGGGGAGGKSADSGRELWNRAGSGGGGAGAAPCNNYVSTPGTLTTGGAGSDPIGTDPARGTRGGNGGNLGYAGESMFGIAGGSAGKCVIGNQYITWAVTGTRLGLITN